MSLYPGRTYSYRQAPEDVIEKGLSHPPIVRKCFPCMKAVIPILELSPLLLIIYERHTILAAITQAVQPPHLVIAIIMAAMDTSTGIAPRHSRPSSIAITTKAARH